MYARVRIVVVSLAFLSLAFSCIESGSYLVDTTESSRIFSVLDHWTSKAGFTGTDCTNYPNFTTVIKGTCYEIARPEGGTESVLLAEEVEPGHSVRVSIFFNGRTESQRSKTLDSLGSTLASEFGPGSVKLEE